MPYATPMWNERRGSAEPRPARQASNAEALVAVAEAALANPDGSRPGGERYQVVLHADEAVLSHDGEGGCELDDGSALSPETARRLACDASVVQNGRKTRTIPPALRRALRSRDRGCRFPGCENRRFLDAHHVHHWAKGGETTARQPPAALPPPPPARARGRLARRPQAALPRSVGATLSGRAAAAARASRRARLAKRRPGYRRRDLRAGNRRGARPPRRCGGAARDRCVAPSGVKSEITPFGH